MGKKKKRYVIVSFLIFIFIFIHICDIRVVSAEDNFNVVIPVNAGETSVRYTEYISDTEGPMGFSVNDGKAYVLDSENERILIYSPDGYVDEIEFGFYSKRMALVEDTIYVVDYFQNKLVEYTKEGEMVAGYGIWFCESENVMEITKVDGELVVISRDGMMNAYDSAFDRFWVNVGHKSMNTAQVRTYEAYRCNIREVTNVLGDGYTMITSEIGTDHLYLEKVITRENAEGEITGYYIPVLGSAAVYPEQTLYIRDGELYVMYGREDSVTIQKAEFQAEYESTLPELCARAREGKRANMEARRQKINPDKVNFELAFWDVFPGGAEYSSVVSMLSGYSRGLHPGILLGKIIEID